jgi:hypothetical protein
VPYRLGLADVMTRVRLVVRASNAAGALEVASPLSDQVRAAPVGSGDGPPPAATTLISGRRGKLTLLR